MTKRIEKKRRKRQYRRAIIGTAAHYQAANTCAAVVNAAMKPIPDCPSIAETLRGCMHLYQTEYSVLAMLEAAKGFKQFSVVKGLEGIRGKWAPVRRSA